MNYNQKQYKHSAENVLQLMWHTHNQCGADPPNMVHHDVPTLCVYSGPSYDNRQHYNICTHIP